LRTKSFALLTDAILERDQPAPPISSSRCEAQGRSVGEALSVVTAAEAPFVQVPNHINVKDGQITLINNDHTILGLRTSTHLAPFVPEPYRLLPLLQSVWYIPAGLDIWNQLARPVSRALRHDEGMQVPPPSYGPVVWNEEQAPIKEAGTVEERLHAHLIATMSGDVRRPTALPRSRRRPRDRPMLRDQLLFLGLIDLQDTVVGGRRATPATRRCGPARSSIWPTSSAGSGPTASIHGRAGHGDRPPVLLALRRRVRDDQRRVPRRR